MSVRNTKYPKKNSSVRSRDEDLFVIRGLKKNPSRIADIIGIRCYLKDVIEVRLKNEGLKGTHHNDMNMMWYQMIQTS